MPKFLGHYGVQPRIRCKLDDFVVLEGRQLFDHATGRRLKNDSEGILGVECQGSDKSLFEGQLNGALYLDFS